ncbi:MAG: GNAT family N-acetyltransferase [Brevirhabdus sp.]
MTPRRALADEDWGAVLALIRGAFAYMDGVIDPPSSMHRLTQADIAQQNSLGEVWLIGPSGAPLACMFATEHSDALYLGKIAVEASQQGRGFARQLVAQAEARAKALDLRCLRLQTRIELVSNHATFERLGFVKTGETRHPGFLRSTSLTFEKCVK